MFGLNPWKNGEDTSEFVPPRVEIPRSYDFEVTIKKLLKEILENQFKLQERLDIIEREVLSYKELELKEAKSDIKELKSEVKHKSIYCEDLLSHMLEHAQVGSSTTNVVEKEPSPMMKRYLQRAKLATPAGKLP